MLDQLAKHSLIDLKINAKGDLGIDFHHTVEDVGISLGQSLKKCIGDKKGIFDNEVKESKHFNAECILDNGKSLNIPQLASLIKNSSFVIANDTGPAHISAHLNAKGVALFGSHTTAYKVSIERENFKAIQVEDLNKLSARKVFEKINL